MLTEQGAGPGGPGGFGRVVVVGVGLMGRRIAGQFARGGYDVVITDANADVLAAAAREAAGIAQGNGTVRADSTLDAAAESADLVIEAIAEDLQAKQELFARLSKLAPAAVLATNTSVLPVTAVAAGADEPGLVVGMHWWNPPDLIPVVEVVRGEQTDPAVIERVVAALSHLGKMPVRVNRDVPGFIGNRLQHALWREAIALIADGVCDAETVDLVVRNTIGLRLGAMGPIENADYVGLDLTLAIHNAVLPSLNRDPSPNSLLRELVEHGNLGARTGRGFLDWPEGAREQAATRLSAHIEAQLSH
jgi:3-hydroxybutyryl-CoA dehydrogenase